MDHTRHRDLFRAEDLSVTLIGAGGIGAATALTLGKMGVGYLLVWDGDVVDDVNLATQLHRLSDVGREKVFALRDMLEEFADDTEVMIAAERVSSSSDIGDYITISAVDSIQARKDIWAAVKNSDVKWYLDARMAAEEFHLYTVDMDSEDQVAWYESMISKEDDENVPEIACTMKATFYTAMIAAGRIGLAVKRIATNQPNPRIFVYNIAKDNLIVI